MLSEFRARLITSAKEHVLLDAMLSRFKECGLVKNRSRQRTDSTHVVAAVRSLNRLELVGQVMHNALNVLAEIAPDWLRERVPPQWFERYPHRFENSRLPSSAAEPGLVAYCEDNVKRDPDDLHGRYYLGEAYVLNGQYDTALEFMSECHRAEPEIFDFQIVILDALFALGRTENDFAWTNCPTVLRLSQSLIDACYEFLRGKRKPRSVDEVKLHFMHDGYLAFSTADLMEALIADGRFVVEADEVPFLAEVRVRRKKDGLPGAKRRQRA